MMKLKHYLSTLAFMTCALNAAISHASLITFTDGQFADSNWTVVTQSLVNGGSVVTNHVGSGGNPGEFREIVNTVNDGSGSFVLGFHMTGSATYDPSTSGAIATIDYQEDSILFVGFGDGQASSPAILQGGSYFFVDFGTQLSANQSSWTQQSLLNLSGSDFRTLLDSSLHPNFSSTGSPMTFGFYRGNSTSGSGYSNRAGIDNWSITLNQESIPTPSTIALLWIPLGLLSLFGRHQKLIRRLGANTA
jgi:hypothetical protein